MKPKVRMISISENPTSQYYKSITKPSWEKFGFEVQDFEAITPKTMDHYIEKYNFDFSLNFLVPQVNRSYYDTEKAIWLSHYQNWVEIANGDDEGAIVIEHDAELLEDINPSEIDSELILFCRWKMVFYSMPGFAAAGSAYYISKRMAQKLIDDLYRLKYIEVHAGDVINIEFTDEKNMPNYQPDWWILHHTNLYGKYMTRKASIVFDRSIGSTIEHGNEYVPIDLSGLRREEI